MNFKFWTWFGGGSRTYKVFTRQNKDFLVTFSGSSIVAIVDVVSGKTLDLSTVSIGVGGGRFVSPLECTPELLLEAGRSNGGFFITSGSGRGARVQGRTVSRVERA